MRVACWRRCPAVANFSCAMPGSSVHVFRKDCFGATPKPTRETRALSGKQKHNRRFRIQVSSNSESRTCMAEAASPSSHSSFCEEVFSRPAHAGTNEVDRTNILAPGFWSGTCRTHLHPAFTPESFRGLAHGTLYPVTAAQLLPIRTGF